MVIYKTTNLINGKIYIGKDVKNKQSYYGSGVLLIKAIKKYGKNNFKKAIIEECDNHDILCEREIYWINELDSKNLNIGYNISDGGSGGCLGCKISDETKNKLTKALKNRIITWGDKISNSMKNKNKSVEHKNKISNTMIEKYDNGYISPSIGIIRDNIFKKKISDSLKGGSGRNKKEIIIEGISYETIKIASESLGISRYLIKKFYSNE